ncbi:DNA translocase FtsK [Bacillus thuringiensis]|uniref:DNA translocase FtsK n=1 Tax=Bacillus thuringiensis TaxID=1428 RepID=UPI002E175289|nr:DNA translocase FtsK [Bacillus thuringiensis]
MNTINEKDVKLYEAAKEHVIYRAGLGMLVSVSNLQRQFRIGHTRASEIMSQLQQNRIVGDPDPITNQRVVLVNKNTM